MTESDSGMKGIDVLLLTPSRLLHPIANLLVAIVTLIGQATKRLFVNKSKKVEGMRKANPAISAITSTTTSITKIVNGQTDSVVTSQLPITKYNTSTDDKDLKPKLYFEIG